MRNSLTAHTQGTSAAEGKIYCNHKNGLPGRLSLPAAVYHLYHFLLRGRGNSLIPPRDHLVHAHGNKYPGHRPDKRDETVFPV